MQKGPQSGSNHKQNSQICKAIEACLRENSDILEQQRVFDDAKASEFKN